MSSSLSNGNSVRPQERKPAVALYRISDAKQDSLPTQRAWAQRVTRRDGLALVGEFDDEGISGADINRPGLESLVAFVKERFYARDPVLYLLVIDLDRFSRRDSLSTGAWLEQLRKHGLRYVATTAQRFDLHNPLDRTLIALGSDFTREPDLRAKSNHVLNGMAERARRGLWMGGAVPYGYRGAPDSHEPPSRSGKLAVRLILGPEEEQEIVRWIFRTYASGRLTANGLARELNARGIKPRRSPHGKWSRNTVLKILANRAYLGCIVWGEQLVGRYHRLEKGMVIPREDKQDREQTQLLRGLKHLPVRLAPEEDCIVRVDAHPALIDQETFEACQRQRERNRENYSAPRAGLKGNVWPLAGQMKCGHCGGPVWTLPKSEQGGKRHGNYTERARVACGRRRQDPHDCPHSGMLPYLEVVKRVVNLLRQKLADPRAVAEMARELERQLAEQARAGRGSRQRLDARVAKLDGAIATATKNLLQFPEDLRADAFEALRALKAERDAAGQKLRDLEAAQREARAIDPEEFKATLALVADLTATWETREEAELLRATFRDLVQEVRLYWRARRPGEKLPRGRQATKRLLRRVEVDLTPSFADLLTMGSRSSRPPRTS
jgi:DNA invertase Pin-like site-specific DNA recombinase